MRELWPRRQWLPLLTVSFLLGAANLVVLRWTMFSTTSSNETWAEQLSLPMNTNGTSVMKEDVVGQVRQGAGFTSSDTTRKMNEHNRVSGGDKDTQDTPSCFRARESNMTISLLDSLPLINLGFPKMGTSSIHSFFGCAGLRSVHYRCNKDQSCAECVRESVSAGEPPLKKCGRSDVYSQLDGKSEPLSAFPNEYFPQIEHMESLVRNYPNATFLLTFRSMSKWYHSITNWPPVKTATKLDFRLRSSNITDFPPGRGRNQQEFMNWFCDHVKRVRGVVPPERLFEIDIESKSTGTRLGDTFDLDPKCWSQANVNFNVHNSSELANSTAKGSVPWLYKSSFEIKGRHGPRPRYPSLPPFPNVLIPHAIASGPNIGTGIEQGIKQPIPENMDWTGTCSALKAHRDGHWQHTSNLTGSVEFALNLFQYYPKEVSWLLRDGVKPDFGLCMLPRQYLSYTTSVGHQCGCKHSDFAPTHSKWTHSGMAAAGNPILLDGRPNYVEISPTVRLAKSLAKAQGTICMAGDSIDLQIYMALGNNLKRAAQLFKEYVKTGEELLSVLQREIKVSYSTKPGDWDSFWKNGQRPPDGDGSFLTARRPPPNGFGSMYSILETKAFFQDAGRARFRYYMSYGWSPWLAEHMEDCTVIVMNLGLHYSSSDERHMGKESRHPLSEDMLAAITFLTNFSASRADRVGVWRSALPQHFDVASSFGHFPGWRMLPQGHKCASLRNKTRGYEQVYNQFYDDLFNENCKVECEGLVYNCTLDTTSTGVQTIHKFLMDNGLRRPVAERVVSGEILRWNTFDIFDVPIWHTKDNDCSHFCYVPALYETAFERLGILLSTFLKRLH